MKQDDDHSIKDIPVRIVVNLDEKIIHWHNETVEVVVVISGNIKIELAGTSYHVTENECIFINKMMPHMIVNSSKQAVYIVIHLNLLFFDNYVPNASRIFFVRNPNITGKEKALKELRSAIARIFFIEKNANNEDYEKKMINGGVSILNILINEFNYICKSPESYRNIEQFERVWTVFRYMLDNHSRRLTLSEMANYVHVSGSYLSHSIKEETGMTFEEWLNMYRTEDAARLLVSKEMSITKISYDCRFSDPRYFNRCFKKFFLCTPSEYRQTNEKLKNNLKGQETIDDIIYNQILDEKMRAYVLGREQIKRVLEGQIQLNLSISIDEKGIEFPHGWNQVLDFGEMKNLYQAERQKLLGEIQNEIHFNYIKVATPFDEDNVQMVGDEIYVDWSSIYDFIDLIYKFKAIPYVKINSKKYAFAKVKNIFFKFIDNAMDIYGQEKILEWKFGIEDEEELLQIKKILSRKYTIEWNLLTEEKSRIQPNLLYDTSFMAPFMIQQVMREERMGNPLNNFNCMFDKTQDEVFHGGTGMIATGLKKPSYYAYFLLNRLGDRVISRGDNYIVTKSGEELQILLWNAPTGIDEQRLSEMKIEENSRYSIFDAESQLMVNIELDGLKDNEYIMKRFSLGRKNGSIYDHFADNWPLKYLSVKEKEYLNKVCRPMVRYDFISGRKNTSIKSILDSTDIELITLNKKLCFRT